MLSSLFLLASASMPIDGGLASPFRVKDAAELIDVGIGHAAPLLTDFDGDGIPDLLVGQFEGGKLRIYRNRGTVKEPKFEGFSWFKTGEQEGRVPAG